MRRSSEMRLWVAALATSLALHAALVAALAVVPEPEDEGATVVRVEIQSTFLGAKSGPIPSSPDAPVVPPDAVAAVTQNSGAPASHPVMPDATVETLAAPTIVEKAIQSPVSPTKAARSRTEQLDAAPHATAAVVQDSRTHASSPIRTDDVVETLVAPAAFEEAAQSSASLTNAARSRTGQPDAAPHATSSVRLPPSPRTESGAIAPFPAASPKPTAQSTRPKPALPAVRPLPEGGRLEKPPVAVPASRATPVVSVAPAASSVLAAPSAPEQVAAIIKPIEPALRPASRSLEQVYARLLASIRALNGAPCFIALAALHDELIRVDGFAREAERTTTLEEEVDPDLPASLDLQSHVVTDAQCEALGFAEAMAGYPEAGLSIDLADAEIASGTVLAGRIGNVDGRWLYLVVVDDEGRVQELHDLRLEDGAVAFKGPLSLTDGPVDTVQLLLAISSDTALETIRLYEGHSAARYFSALREEVLRAGGRVDFGIAPFFVR